VPEAWKYLGNPEKGEGPSLEAVTRRLAKAKQAEKTYVSAVMNWKVVVL
jgi:hypothetical protein